MRIEAGSLFLGGEILTLPSHCQFCQTIASKKDQENNRATNCYLGSFPKRNMKRCLVTKFNEYFQSRPDSLVSRLKIWCSIHIMISRWEKGPLQFGPRE